MSVDGKAVLLRAAEHIDAGWTQSGWYAVDGNGLSTVSEDRDAVAWCAVGAIEKAVGELCGSIDDMSDAMRDAKRLLERRVSDMTGVDRTKVVLVSWNDDEATTADEVAGTMREAAELEPEAA